MSPVNAHWSRLEVTIPVTYRFAATEATWPESGRTRFKRDFERIAHQSWSRRYVVAHDSTWDPQRVEVIVRIAELPNAPAARLWHIWLLPFRIPGLATCVSYRYRGQVPEGLEPDGEVRWGEHVGDVALAQMTAEDIDCRETLDGFLQRGTDHEVGHMLGLQHPGCSRDDAPCYGRPHEPHRRRRIMGLGSRVTMGDYHWALRIMQLHDPRRDWQLVSDRWFVQEGGRRVDRSRAICE